VLHSGTEALDCELLRIKSSHTCLELNLGKVYKLAFSLVSWHYLPDTQCRWKFARHEISSQKDLKVRNCRIRTKAFRRKDEHQHFAPLTARLFYESHLNWAKKNKRSLNCTQWAGWFKGIYSFSVSEFIN